MNKLLTDDELEVELKNILSEYRRSILEDRRIGGVGDAYDKLVALVKSQKIAHGEMIIGEDEPESENPHSDRSVGARWSNELRKEQRRRNK